MRHLEKASDKLIKLIAPLLMFLSPVALGLFSYALYHDWLNSGPTTNHLYMYFVMVGCFCVGTHYTREHHKWAKQVERSLVRITQRRNRR